jgi:hypothetical protein
MSSPPPAHGQRQVRAVSLITRSGRMPAFILHVHGMACSALWARALALTASCVATAAAYLDAARAARPRKHHCTGLPLAGSGQAGPVRIRGVAQ